MVFHVMRIGAVSLMVCAGTVFAGPTTYSVAIDQAQSSVGIQTDAMIPIDGALIGNYDPTTNPTGTQTRPGLFGGSGNNPIDMSMDLHTVLNDSSTPIGAFDLVLDEVGGVAEIANFSLDALGGTPITVNVEGDVQYSSFNTINPTSAYIGGITVTIPLGSGEVTQFDIVQDGTAVGSIVPTGQPNEYLLSVGVPAQMMITIDALGQPVPVPPTPILIPVTGTFTVASGHVDMSISFQSVNNAPTPAAPGALVNVPFDLPTILPPGSTAHILLNADVLEGMIDSTIDVAIVAGGDATGCYPDCDTSGSLNIFDYICYGNAYSTGDPYADCDGSGSLNIFDYICYGNAYAAGCP
ncbi:MAG: hypothetical protein H6815_00905 [Phycisphaeraceae bacterium]|nr:hypothetical protein [Phycisphaerales bacterium]MCB9858984.1 hypothetical protein [Phycisphaeraceae bacterium]